jgi:hypothetical protein
MVGGIFFLANTLLIGCESEAPPKLYKNPGSYSEREIENTMASKPAGIMTELEQVGPKEYRISKENPSSTTGVIVHKMDGSQEVIPQDRISSLMDQSGNDGGYGMGTVLASGLLGYMMGRNAGLNPYVYKDDTLFFQSIANRELIERRIKEEEKQRPGWSGRSYYFGSGRRYDGGDHSLRTSSGSITSGTTKSGFFSRFTSSIRSFGS